MSGDDPHLSERQGLLTRLLDAVKQCQVRFGGRSELATDSDSRVSCLCATWEAVLQHGMKKTKAFKALRHVTERAGLGKMTDFFSEVKNFDTDPVYWHYVREHLTKHEQQRFNTLKQISSDMGRGRAWLRACMNEHSLERYMHMLIEKEELLSQYYHDWAFMCDQERNSMLPTMAAGLGSILFAITIDRPELNKGYQNLVHVVSSGDVVIPGTGDDEPRPVIAGDSLPVVKKKEKKRKKKVANVVSFDEDDSEIKSHRHSSVASTNSSVAGDDRQGDDSHNHHDDGSAFQNCSRSSSLDIPVFQSDEVSTGSNQFNDTSGLVGSRGLLMQQKSSVIGSLSMKSSISNDITSKSSTGSISSLDTDTGGGMMFPVGDGLDVEMVPMSTSFHSGDITHSDASSEIVPFSRDDVYSASLALAAAQKSLESARTDGDGGITEARLEQTHQLMTHDELKQAVVAMMLRKDEVEEHSHSLQTLLQQEMDTSSMLRAEIAELKHLHSQRQEADLTRISKLQSENELLKHQLKKYVNAVQLLRTEGINKEADSLGIRLDEPQPSIPPPKANIDYSHEASEYEQKLIQVAEMHGELMEFNEILHRQLNVKEAMLRRLRQELVTLRGPVSCLDCSRPTEVVTPSRPAVSSRSTLPYEEHFEESPTSSLDSLSLQGRNLINIWIPSAFLRGTSSDKFHVYQVYVRICDEEWNIFRRYSQFLDLHTRLKKVYPLVNKFAFPPKKTVGFKDTRVVESRRQGFQQYLRSVINLMMEKNPDLCTDTCKAKLTSLLPFFGDQPEPGGNKGKKKRQQPLASRAQQASQTQQIPPSQGIQYQGW